VIKDVGIAEAYRPWRLGSVVMRKLRDKVRCLTLVLQMAEVAVPRTLFAEILRLIADLRPRSPPLPA
jgi:hypothetical protein